MNPQDSQIQRCAVVISLMGANSSLRQVEVDRPSPGEELNVSGDPATPRQAATVIVLRGGEEALEVLLVRRTPSARFMGGVWVFPGGAVDAAEGTGDASHRVAALRELAEEAALTVADPAELVEFSRWITPAEVTIRFDTHFFLVSSPEGQQPRVDGEECVDLRWLAPREALDLHACGQLDLVFPTIKTLEQLAPFASAAEALAHARGRDVVPVQPRVVVTGEIARVLLPGEPGYDG
jgi:8-oxo-dGTP pyrophosphatase MutT (NUDIX family)